MKYFTNIRNNFPLLKERKIIYLDTAASSEKPEEVLSKVQHFYKTSYSNIHRGAHFLGDQATEMYENAREEVSQFISAKTPREVIFTKNATESINLVARSLGDDESFFKEGDRIILTKMEHHANMIPWFQLAKRKKLTIEYVDFSHDKELQTNALEKLLEKPTKLFAFPHISNVFGTKNPVRYLCKKAKEKGVLTLIDACQSVPHIPINVEEIKCDFFVFSGHKMYGPSGIGVLYGKQDLLKKIPPFLGGGGMIREVSYTDFSLNEIPGKFEAGTPPIAEAIGVGAATCFLKNIGMQSVQQHDEYISHLANQLLSDIPELTIISHKNSCGLLSFFMNDLQNFQVSDYLSQKGICIRGGHHCAEPLHKELGIKTTLRASFGIYTTEEEIQIFAKILKEAIYELR
jgi:cysteine desulfurase/selenocysteine lyase